MVVLRIGSDPGGWRRSLRRPGPPRRSRPGRRNLRRQPPDRNPTLVWPCRAGMTHVRSRGTVGSLLRLRVRPVFETDDAAPGLEDADGAVEPPGARFDDELVNGADAVGRAKPDVRPLAPDLEVLVDVAGQADEPALGGAADLVAEPIAGRTEPLGG